MESLKKRILQLEEKLSESESNYAYLTGRLHDQIIETRNLRNEFQVNFPGIMLEVNSNGYVTMASEEAYTFFELNKTALINGIHISRVGSKTYENNLKQSIKKVLANQEKIKLTIEHPKCGKTYNLHLIVAPVFIQNSTKGVRILITDVTNCIQAHVNRLEHKLKLTKEANVLKSEFLADMSHEIRTPLNGILGFVELLSSQQVDQATYNQYLQIIKHSGNQLAALLNDIIDISKIEANRISILQDDFQLNEMLEGILMFFSNNHKSSSVNLVLDKGSRHELLVNTDAVRLKQILSNLLSNALKFTESGTIKFGYSINDDTFTFFVQDTGKGIPYNKQENIFERFVQNDRDVVKPKRQRPGAGAISRGLIELLGGEIWVESTPGLGSSFYFSLPV
ncbi:MAG: hypothetical protein HC896_04820, partial [Bacteroidales bacterium]|nr:hypothetical protein [Bacteroidales bacterium]